MTEQQADQMIDLLKKVAQESTMMSLVPALGRELQQNQSRLNVDTETAQDNINAGGSAIRNVLSSVGGSLGTALVGSSRILTSGNARLSDALNVFKDSTGKFGGVFGDAGKLIGAAGVNAAQYIETNVDTFRDLSKVGGGLEGELGLLRQQAALTRMPLSDFASLIQQNTETLAAFAGGVAGGQRAVARLSNDLFNIEGGAFADQLYNMGYTFEEMNELLVDNINLTRRRELTTEAQRRASIESALELAKQMDIMAKITGRDAKAARDEITERARQGATQARIRLLERQGVEGASEAYNAAQAELANGPKVLRDLFDDTVQLGVPLTEATKNFAATNAEAYALAQQAREATARGDQAAAAEFARQAVEATARQADSVQGLSIATLQNVSSVAATQAQVLEETGPLIDAINQHSRRMEEELGRTVTFTEAFNDMLATMTENQRQQAAGEGGDTQLNLARSAETLFRNASSAVNTEIAQIFDRPQVSEALNDFASKLDDLNDPVQFQESLDRISRGIIGSQGDIEVAREMIANAAELGLQPSDITVLENAIAEIEAANATLNDPNATPEERREARTAIGNAKVDIEGISEDAANAIGAPLKDFLNSAARARLQAAADAGNEDAARVLEESEDGKFFEGLQAIGDMLGFNTGTLGVTGNLFNDFGAGTPAMLHGREAVIPERSAEGQMLKQIREGGFRPQMFSNLMNSMSEMAPAMQGMADGLRGPMEQMISGVQASGVPGTMREQMTSALENLENIRNVSPTRDTNTFANIETTMQSLISKFEQMGSDQSGSNVNQSTLTKEIASKLDELNTSMRMVAVEMSQSNGIGKKSLNATRAMSGNAFRGIG